MIPEEVVQFLSNIKSRDNNKTTYDSIRNILKKEKVSAVSNNDQNNAKQIWIHEQILKAQQLYLEAFAEIKSKEFYKGWCTLEQCEICLNNLRLHYDINSNSFYFLDFIDEYVEKYQSLFPYSIFMSPEILEKKKKCNICGQTISIRKPCGHVVGEIYNGEMCIRIVTDMEFLGIAMVKSPLQKYSVCFSRNPETGESEDHYNYSVVNYLIERLNAPTDGWSVYHTKVRHPHSKFIDVGRNDKCPCGSEKKYKKCCLNESGVLMPHVEFGFEVKPPEGMRGIEYSY